MYNISSVCFMCLSNNSSIKNIFQKDIENATANQVKYVLPELMIMEPEEPVNICITCQTKLHTFYTFKKMCLENYCRLKYYIKSLRTSQDTINTINQDLKLNITSNEINRNEELTKEDTDIEITIKQGTIDPLMTNEVKEEQENQTIEDITIKEECILSSDSDSECYRPFQFVKCEVSDEPQTSSSSFANENENHIDINEYNASPLYNQNFLPKADWTKHTSLHNGGKDFKCLLCNKKFTAKHSLKAHMKLHDGIKEFECTVCQKKFSRNTHLKVHMKLHSGIKDYECTICSKKFTQNSHLKLHMKMHDGIKNFECNICHKKFTQKGTLTTHMKFHAGIKDYQCKICNKRFSQNGYLKVHTVNVHSAGKKYGIKVKKEQKLMA